LPKSLYGGKPILSGDTRALDLYARKVTGPGRAGSRLRRLSVRDGILYLWMLAFGFLAAREHHGNCLALEGPQNALPLAFVTLLGLGDEVLDEFVGKDTTDFAIAPR